MEPLPNVLKSLVRRIMHWGIVNPDIEPDTAIVNFYDTDDCIPPHIDHEDFVRPFVTISLLSEQSIMFGNRLIPLDAGEFGGGAIKTIPLPPGEAQACRCRHLLPRAGMGCWVAPLQGLPSIMHAACCALQGGLHA